MIVRVKFAKIFGN